MDVMVSYNTDLDKAKEVIIHRIESHPETVIIDGKTDCYTDLFKREFVNSIIKKFKKNNIEIPYNKMDLYIKDSSTPENGTFKMKSNKEINKLCNG